MSDIYLDVEHAGAVMRSVEQAAQARGRAHQAAAPSFAADAAGKGFVGHGQRLQAAFERMHATGARRISAVVETAQAAQRQFAEVERVDGEGARAVGRLGEAL